MWRAGRRPRAARHDTILDCVFRRATPHAPDALRRGKESACRKPKQAAAMGQGGTIESLRSARYQTGMTSLARSPSTTLPPHAPAQVRHVRALRIWLGAIAALLVAMIL